MVAATDGEADPAPSGGHQARRPARSTAPNRTPRGSGAATTVLPPAPQPNRGYDYGRQSPDRSGEPATQPAQNRSNRNSGRSNSNWNSTRRRGTITVLPARRGVAETVEAASAAPLPPSSGNSLGGRSGRGG